MNWKSVTTKTAAGSAIPLTQVMDVQEVNSEGLEPWQADGNLYPTLMIRATATRGVTITSGDVAGMKAVPRGVPLTVVAILYDAVNGVGSGALTETWTNAVVADIPASGASNKFAGGSITFICYSTDGSTDPNTSVQAA
jgi:hypothetical protein